MNKILSTLALMMGLAFAASAQQNAAASFLNGSYALLPYATNTASTNYTIGNINTTNLAFVKYWYQTNSTTYPYTSYLAPQYVFGQPLADVGLWANRDGTAALANFAIAFNDSSLNANTNALVITLTTFGLDANSVIPGAPAFLDTQSQNQFTFTTPVSNGTNWVVISTNLPTAFLQGAHNVRVSIQTGTIGTNNGAGFTVVTGPYNALVTNNIGGWQIGGMAINGYKPILNN